MAENLVFKGKLFGLVWIGLVWFGLVFVVWLVRLCQEN